MFHDCADRQNISTRIGLLYRTRFETVLDDANIGSVSGGGRYDGLIGMFSGKDVPAVASLGLERLLVILEERGESQNIIGTQVWVTVLMQNIKNIPYLWQENCEKQV